MVKRKRTMPGATMGEKQYNAGWNARRMGLPRDAAWSANQARGWLVCDAALRTEEVVRALKEGRTPPIAHHGREMNSVPTSAV